MLISNIEYLLVNNVIAKTVFFIYLFFFCTHKLYDSQPYGIRIFIIKGIKL